MFGSQREHGHVAVKFIKCASDASYRKFCRESVSEVLFHCTSAASILNFFFETAKCVLTITAALSLTSAHAQMYAFHYFKLCLFFVLSVFLLWLVLLSHAIPAAAPSVPCDRVRGTRFSP